MLDREAIYLHLIDTYESAHLRKKELLLQDGIDDDFRVKLIWQSWRLLDLELQPIMDELISFQPPPSVTS